MILNAEGMPVHSNPMANALEQAKQRMSRLLSQELYTGIPLGTIVDQHGTPIVRGFYMPKFLDDRSYDGRVTTGE